MIRRIILAYWILTPCLVAGQSTTYGLVGGTVTLKADKNVSDEILWKHKGNKVVEFDGNEELVFGSFSDRITLDWVSADLTITNLRYEDSGEYVLETYKHSQLTKSVIYLEVTGGPKTDSDIIIAIATGAGVLVIVILLALLFCKLKHKACFAKGNDEERASHGETGESRNDEESQSLLPDKMGQVSDSDPETPPMTFQQKREMFARGLSPAVPPPVPKNPFRNCTIDKENVAQPRECTEKTVSECDPDVLPGVLNDDSVFHESKAGEDMEREDGEFNKPGAIHAHIQRFESMTKEEKPKVKNAGCDEEEKSPLAGPLPPPVVKIWPPHSSITSKPQNLSSKDDADEQRRDTNSHQVPGETEETNESKAEEEKPKESDTNPDEDEESVAASASAPPAGSSEDSTTTTKQSVGESEPPGLQEEKESSGFEEGTTCPEQQDAEVEMVHDPQSEQADTGTHSGEDKQQDRHRVSEDHSEPDADEEDVKKEKNVPLENPQNPVTPKPDHINTSTCQEPSQTKQADSGREEE
ncbi:protein IWS1 homolog [Mugil cephalus]|uniref:protein IWS1 homolog n=1 Tax=Mugil cephalus TaxID=48193 RepID=UPI001FB7A22F|nr:protein IWS1 homolog [Mugil cephalus]